MQTRSYNEAVAGIKMATFHRHYPNFTLDQAQVYMIQTNLLIAMDANPQGEAPLQFMYTKLAMGVFSITCANEPSKAWLTWTVSGLGELW